MNKIIHLSSDADFDNYVYTSVYASANATIAINGNTVALLSGLVLNILVSSIDSNANVYLIGNKRVSDPSILS